MNNRSIHRSSWTVYVFLAIFYGSVIGIVGYPMISHRHVQAQVRQQLDQARTKTMTETTITGSPSRMTISRIGLDLPIQMGTYDTRDRSWTLNNDHAFIATNQGKVPAISSDRDSQPNIAVLYGHDVPSVFAPTTKLVYGDILDIRLSDGKHLRYYFTYSKQVTPSDTSILTSKRNASSLAVLTCSGLFSESRRLMYFTQLPVIEQNARTERSTV